MMKYPMVIRPTFLIIFLILSNCSADSPKIGCAADSDCKNNRICEQGMCVNPPSVVENIVSESFEPGGDFDTGGNSQCDLTAATGANAIIVDLPLTGEVTVTSWPNGSGTHAMGTTGECAWDLVASPTDYTVYSPVSGTVVALRNSISDQCKYTFNCCSGNSCKCTTLSGKYCNNQNDVSTCDCSSRDALVAAGTCSTCQSSYGNYVVIEPDNAKGNYLLMAHLAENSINANITSGSKVCPGTPLARMGTTGNSTGRHVHFALSKTTSGSFASVPMALRYKKSISEMPITDLPRQRMTITSALKEETCTSSCSDFTKNGNETSADCGGGTCPPCADGLACRVNTDCINGYCASNVCISGPQILVDNLSNPYNLALDAANIYWVENRTTGGALRKVQKSGGTVITLSASLSEPTALSVDTNYVYVLERNSGTNGMVRRIPLGGGIPELVVGGLNNSQNHLVQSGNNLYWGDYVAGTGGVIKTAPKGVSVSSSIVVQGNGLLNLQTALDSDGTYLYVRNDSNQMLRFPIGGGSPTVLGSTTTTSWLSAIRVMAGTIYYTGDSIVGAIPTAGGTAITLATGSGPSFLAIDSSYVYYMDGVNPGGNVKRVSVAGSQSKSYYPQVGGGIAVDTTHVYWITTFFPTQGKVMRAPK